MFRWSFSRCLLLLLCRVEVVLGPRLLEIDGAWRNDRPQPFVDFSGRITEPHGEAAAAEATEAAWQGRNHEPLEPFEPYFAHGAMQTQIVKTIFRPIRCV